MVYLEFLSSGYFKKDKCGKTIFFPWSVFGRGRVLPDEPTEAKIRAFVNLHWIVSMSATLGVGMSFGSVWILLLIPIVNAWFYFGTRTLISDCPYSDEKITFKENLTSAAVISNKFALWLLVIVSSLFFLAGIFMAIDATFFGQLLKGLFVSMVFGTCGALFGYMLRVKYSI